MKKTQNEKVLSALAAGKELTVRQIRAQYKVANPRAVVNTLRKTGAKIYTVERGSSMKYSLKKV